MAVNIKDNGLNAYKENLMKLKNKVIAVGIFSKESSEVLTKAIVNEFGEGIIPERSFLRSTYNKNKVKVQNRFETILKNMSKKGYNLENKLKLIGIEQESAVKKTITDLKFPPNAPLTIRLKGSDNPLIDTGEMRSKISSEVRKK